MEPVTAEDGFIRGAVLAENAKGLTVRPLQEEETGPVTTVEVCLRLLIRAGGSSAAVAQVATPAKETREAPQPPRLTVEGLMEEDADVAENVVAKPRHNHRHAGVLAREGAYSLIRAPAAIAGALCFEPFVF